MAYTTTETDCNQEQLTFSSRLVAGLYLQIKIRSYKMASLVAARKSIIAKASTASRRGFVGAAASTTPTIGQRSLSGNAATEVLAGSG